MDALEYSNKQTRLIINNSLEEIYTIYVSRAVNTKVVGHQKISHINIKLRESLDMNKTIVMYELINLY